MMVNFEIPTWVVFHVPHDSTSIPTEVRDQFILSDEELSAELIQMTDHHTGSLVPKSVPDVQIIRFPLSRLVVDVERFESDLDEPMAAIGMGVIYEATHQLKPLRRKLSAGERENLLSRWYRPHHELLTNRVNQLIEKHGRALIIDLHSFPKFSLPYEANQKAHRPEICIGTDDFHTSNQLVVELTKNFEAHGFEVGINTPFAGALVPGEHYKNQKQVESVMIEIRRDLYLNEMTGQLNDESTHFGHRLEQVIYSSLMTS